MKQQLFDSQTANGSSEGFWHMAGMSQIWVAGTFDGAAVTIESRAPDDMTYVAMDGGVLAAPGSHVIEAPPGMIRLTVSGAGVSTSINAWAYRDR